MEWIFTDNRFPVLFPLVCKYHFQQLVAECFCAAVVEKQLRNNGLPVPLCRDNAALVNKNWTQIFKFFTDSSFF